MVARPRLELIHQNPLYDILNANFVLREEVRTHHQKGKKAALVHSSSILRARQQMYWVGSPIGADTRFVLSRCGNYALLEERQGALSSSDQCSSPDQSHT